MEAGKRDRTIFGWGVVMLVFMFIGHLMPSDELPSPTLKTLTILIELALVVGLIGMAPRVLRSVSEGPERRVWIVLLVVALISAFGIFGIRLFGDSHAEWPSRTSKSSTPAAGIPKQMHDLMESTERHSEKFTTTRWAKAMLTKDLAQIKTLTRRDLQEARDACHLMRGDIESILKLFAEALSKGIDLSTASTDAATRRPETWQAAHRAMSTTDEYMGVIDQHWDEWAADPFPSGSNLKPWQLEVQRLQEVTATSSKEFHALLNPATAPSAAEKEAAALQKQVQDLYYSYGKAAEKFNACAWINSKERRNLPRRDLHEARDLSREMQERAGQVLKVIAEADSKHIDLSTSIESAVLTKTQFWLASEKLARARFEKMVVIDQNWDAYVANPFPDSEKDYKPWQREVGRLEDISSAASKEVRAVIRPEEARLTKQLAELIDKWEKVVEKLDASRWLKGTKPQDVTRQDLQEARGYCLEEGQLTEQILKVFAEAESKKIDLSDASDEALLTRPEYWRLLQSGMKPKCERLAVLEQHWDEWQAKGNGENIPEKKLTSWQREAKRLRDAATASAKQVEALIASASTTPAPAAPPMPPSSAAAPSPSQNSTVPPIPPTSSAGPFLPRQPPAPPVSQNPSAPPSPPRNNMDELVLKTHLLAATADYAQALSRLQQTRWVKSPDANAYHPQKITSADLHDANEKLREFIATVDKVIADLNAVKVPVPATEKEYWRVKKEVSLLFQQLTALLEENWKEWHVTGIQPKTGEPKPWQKDALRLQGQIDKLKEMKLSSMLL